MNRLKHVWSLYRQLGVQPELDYHTKRRIIITNIMSFALALALCLPTLLVLNSNLPTIFLVSIFQAALICALVPVLNAGNRPETAAILFSINLPLLIVTANLLHKILLPDDQLVESDYYRSHLWLVCSVAFPFISIDPKKKGLLVFLSALPILVIFGLNQLYGLFDRDFESMGFERIYLFRENVVATITSLLLLLIFFFMEEITNSLQREVESQADELDKLSVVAQETTNAIAIFDKKGNFEWVNEGFIKIYEQNIDDLLVTEGSSLFETIPNSYASEEIPKAQSAKEVQAILRAIRESIEDKKPVHYEYYTVTKSGKQIIVQTTLTPILDDEGNIKKLIGIDSDISKLKQAEKKIRKQKEEIQSQADMLLEKNELLESKNTEIRTQAEQLRGFNEHLEELVSERTERIQEQNEKLLDYAYSNSHLVRAPLARILGLTDLLNDPKLSAEVVQQLMENIRASALELDEIIRGVGKIVAEDQKNESSQ